MKKPIALFSAVLALFVVLSAQAKIVVKDITYTIRDDKYLSQLVYDDAVKEKLPAVLMVPNWMGMTEESLEKAKKVASMGYVVLMADMYGVDLRPENTQQASTAAGLVRADRQLMRRRVAKAADVLKAQADSAPVDVEKFGAIGFCFGGGTVLELARSGYDVDAVVSFHGNLDTPDPDDAKNIKGSVLVLHGAADPHVPAEQVMEFSEEMTAADVDWTLVAFGNAVHSFTNPHANRPGSAEYHYESAKRSFEMMRDFFEDELED